PGAQAVRAQGDRRGARAVRAAGLAAVGHARRLDGAAPRHRLTVALVGLWAVNTSATSVVALVGNPRPGSRTLAAAEAVANRLAPLVPGGPATVSTVDLVGLRHELFADERPQAEAAQAT